MNANEAYEVNFDGLVGPTHNFSGLSFGNVASMIHKKAISHPRAAFLQGLEKMKFLSELGIPQAVLPPHERPHFPTLKALGFTGNDLQILEKVRREDPELLLNCSSSAGMWTANAATVCPSGDSLDSQVHFTPANLSSKFHRSIEPEETAKFLKAIFQNPEYFTHHPPLPPGTYFSDEGAANHNRFCHQYGEPGIQLFVYGRSSFDEQLDSPKKFPARQTFESCKALARTHLIAPKRVIFAQQNPYAVDAGVFHNDVISVANQQLFLYHEMAFVNTEGLIKQLQLKFPDLIPIKISESEISLKEAVSTYIFNSQIVTLSNGSMALIAPIQCENHPKVKNYLDHLTTIPSVPIKSIYYLNLNESMSNGGGPACLRLRVVLTKQELSAINLGVIFTEELYKKLLKWGVSYYRETLSPKDLEDPLLYEESRNALNELTSLLKLGSIYSFQ